MSLAFALLDLKRFKAVNDTYGHPIGDQVLKTMSNMLKKRLRMTDLIGRSCGEDFAVALPDVSPSNARLVLDKVRDAFSKIQLIRAGGVFTVTMSRGVAMFPDFEDVPTTDEGRRPSALRGQSERPEPNRTRRTLDRRQAHCRRLITLPVPAFSSRFSHPNLRTSASAAPIRTGTSIRRPSRRS